MPTVKDKETCLAIVADLENFIEDLINDYTAQEKGQIEIGPKVFELRAKLETLRSIKQRMHDKEAELNP